MYATETAIAAINKPLKAQQQAEDVRTSTYNTHAMHALPFDTELTVHCVHKHQVRNASASQPAQPVQVEICRDK